jgi:type II secretory pathway component PulF
MNNPGPLRTFTPAAIARAQWRIHRFTITGREPAKCHKRRISVYCPFPEAAPYGTGRQLDEILRKEKLSATGEAFERLQVRRRAHRKEIARFYSAMAKNLRVNTPLAETLQRCASGARTAFFRGVLGTMCLYTVREGGALSKCMRLFPEAFDDIAVALIEAGESSGGLVSVFDRLAASAKETARLSGRITGMLVYPAILAVAGSGVLAVIQFFMLPKLMPMFEAMMTSNMPLSTRIVMGIGGFVEAHPWMPGLVAGAGAWRLSKRSAMLRSPACQRLVLKIPILGELVRDYSMLRAIRTLSLMLDSVVSPELTWNVTARVSGNASLAEYFRGIHARCKNGAPLDQAFYAERHALGELGLDLAHHMRTARNTGRPSEELNEVADYLSASVNTRLDALPVFLNMAVIAAAMPFVLLLALAIVEPTLVMANDVMFSK